MMTPAASTFFVRSEFDDFLHASVGVENNEMPLTVLSALVRLNVDPWGEAAELSELPKSAATQRLASLITQLPSGRWVQADCEAIANRLVELLPARSTSTVPLVQKVRGLAGIHHSATAKFLVCAALGIASLIIIIAANREQSLRGDYGDIPGVRTTSPSGTPPQSQ